MTNTGKAHGPVSVVVVVMAVAAVSSLMTVGACSAGHVDSGGGADAGTPALDASSGGDGADGSRSATEPRSSDGPVNSPQDAAGADTADSAGGDTPMARDAAAADGSGPDSMVADVAGRDQNAADGGGGAPDLAAIDGPILPESPGVFVGVGYGGRRIRSIDDGMSWIDDVSIAANGGDDNNLLRTVTWGNGQFVALGFRVITSPNGKDWHDYGAVIGQWIGAAVYAQAQYVGVGGFGLRATSPDGITWTHHDIDTIATHADSGDALVFASNGGGRFVSTNDDGRRTTSTDGRTWVYSTGATATLTTDLAFGNGVFVGIGGTGVVVSADGATWSDAAQLATAVHGLVFAQGHFTATASGHVFTSADGRAWIDHPVGGLAPGGLVYGHGTYINVIGLRLRRSTDGISWAAAVVLPGTNSIQCVTFGPMGAP